MIKTTGADGRSDCFDHLLFGTNSFIYSSSEIEDVDGDEADIDELNIERSSSSSY
jgi:hypothetical protein